jgi:hypothetical protein
MLTHDLLARQQRTVELRIDYQRAIISQLDRVDASLNCQFTGNLRTWYLALVHPVNAMHVSDARKLYSCESTL